MASLVPRKTTASGQTNLHIFRLGRSYEKQKGAIYRREWNNLVFTVQPQPVAESDLLYFDIRRPLPYPDEAFDAVYALHIVEHLTSREVDSFLREVYRLLKPGCIIRVSTPDLEDVCKAYVQRLEEYERNPSKTHLIRYEWSVLELLDQIARDQSGGLMKEYIRYGYYDTDYARLRFRDVFDEFYVLPAPSLTDRPRATGKLTFIQRLRQLTPASFRKGIYRRCSSIFNNVVMQEGNSAEVDPRQSGENNKWLYDHLALSLLLQKSGFHRLSRKTFKTSDIADWHRFDLDRSTFGDYAIEPSLYMEARKP